VAVLTCFIIWHKYVIGNTFRWGMTPLGQMISSWLWKNPTAYIFKGR